MNEDENYQHEYTGRDYWSMSARENFQRFIDAQNTLRENKLISESEMMEAIHSKLGQAVVDDEREAFPERIEAYLNEAQRDRLICNTRREVAEVAALLPIVFNLLRNNQLESQRTGRRLKFFIALNFAFCASVLFAVL